MQEQSINLKAYWELPSKPLFRADADVDSAPLTGPGYLAFYRSYSDKDEHDDYPRDRMQRVCCNFKGAYGIDDEAIPPGALDATKFYTLAGVALFGESTGNPLMPITYARYGAVNYRNTGRFRIEAGDDVHFLWPTKDFVSNFQQETSEPLWKDALVAITVPGHVIRSMLENLLVDKKEKRGRISFTFVGRSLLAADPGAIGSVFING